MHIQWTAFGEVLVVSFGVAIGIIAVFAIGVGLLSAPGPTPESTHLTVATAGRRTTAPRAPSTSRYAVARKVTAWLCFLVCAFAVAYGLYMIIAR
jgi:hypothetical protein